MPVIILRPSKSEISSKERPPICPHCGSDLLQSWGFIAKIIQDLQQISTEVHRYRCTECGRTFRHYPEGVDRANQTIRLRKMAAIAWVMGLSSRDVVDVFNKLGIDLSHMTVWREGRELARQLQEGKEHGACATLKKYDIEPRIVDAIEFARRHQVLLLRHAASDVDIDLSLAWLPFELESIAAAETVTMQGVSLRIPRPEDLIIYKVVAWPPQDRQDFERLLALHGQQIDLDRVRRLVREIGAALDDSTRAAEFEDLLDRL